MATRSTISRVSLDGRRYEVLVNNLVNAIAVDYDYRYVSIALLGISNVHRAIVY